jgi:hypothetical protein
MDEWYIYTVQLRRTGGYVLLLNMLPKQAILVLGRTLFFVSCAIVSGDQVLAV